jgi:hypothetical protein
MIDGEVIHFGSAGLFDVSPTDLLTSVYNPLRPVANRITISFNEEVEDWLRTNAISYTLHVDHEIIHGLSYWSFSVRFGSTRDLLLFKLRWM